MKFLRLALIIALTLVSTTLTAVAKVEVATEAGLGEKLVRQLWADMQKPDIEGIEKTIAEGFQSVHQFGASNREEEIELIKGLKLGNYTLSDMKITQNESVIVATYFVSVEETIMGKRLQKKPEPRLSVFVKTDSGWKWIAHANIKSLK